jgi:hypothetical protein
VLVLCSGAFAAQQNGTMVSVPQVQNALVQGRSMGLPIMHTFYQTKDVRGNGVCYTNRTAYNTQKFLEDAAHQELCKTKVLIKRICDQIDKNMGVHKDCFMLPVVNIPACPASRLTALEELQKIESYVPNACSSQAMYRSLAEEHTYVERLMDRIAMYEAYHFKSPEDALLNLKKIIPGLSQPLSELIKKRAQDKYAEQAKRGPAGLAGGIFMALVAAVIAFL